ncbi:MAG: hypothetical protein JJT90_10215 [Ectothiorhodospiraceae bacterium]|nr:hypothetical protein [Ectothiorhodospiraceae bacterium]
MRHVFLINGRRPNPLMQVLGVIGGALMLLAALFVGAFVFLALLGLAVLGGLLFSLRLWWLRRQFRKAAEQQHRAGTTHRDGAYRRHSTVIEGRVTSRRDD